MPRESLGELLRSLGQNPTQAEVAELEKTVGATFSYDEFLAVLNRPDGWKPAGTAGQSPFLSSSLRANFLLE